MKVIVVGAGIGGLAAAVALKRGGSEVKVFEKSTELKELGAGLGLSPNAMKALRMLELESAVTAAGNPLDSGARILTAEGRLLLEISSERLEERFGGATIGIHRAALKRILLEAYERAGGEVMPAHEFVGYAEDRNGDRIEVRFVSDASGNITEHADLLVGADGLRSSVRRHVLDDGAPDYAGCVAWRGLVSPCATFLDGYSGFEIQGRGSQFGLVSLGRDSAYWFFTRNSKLSGSEPPSDNKSAVIEHTEGWCEPVPSVVRATRPEDIHYDRIYHREPAERWGEGQVTLLGDAAHPMTPDLGQGACQAIEDAVVLGRSLAPISETLRAPFEAVSTAVSHYSDERRARTAYVSQASLRAGRISRVENPLLLWLRNTTLRMAPKNLLIEAQLKQMEKINTWT